MDQTIVTNTQLLHFTHQYKYTKTHIRKEGDIPLWPENLTGIKFDEIASKLHNKNMTDFKFDEMPGKKAHSTRKINIDGYNLTVSAKNVKPSN